MVNPTEIYNEGWMVRLLVKKSIEKQLKINPIDFAVINNWTSEALISSPFNKAPEKKEGYTHVDIALGDFSVDFAKSGEIIINNNAGIFGVIEAKMKSNLGKGTTNVENYNQASRNVVCIAKNTLGMNCNSFFVVVAPEKYLKKNKIEEQIKRDKVKEQVESRFSIYDEEFQTRENKNNIIEKIDDIDIRAITYEEWINAFDNLEKKDLRDFYEEAKKWNKL